MKINLGPPKIGVFDTFPVGGGGFLLIIRLTQFQLLLQFPTGTELGNFLKQIGNTDLN